MSVHYAQRINKARPTLVCGRMGYEISMNLDKLKQEIVEKVLDKCTDPETGELHIGKYDHEYLEKVITAALTTLENN